MINIAKLLENKVCIIQLPTAQAMIELMEYLADNNLSDNYGLDAFSSGRNWDSYKENTCIRLYTNKTNIIHMNYADKEWYLDNMSDIHITPFEEIVFEKIIEPETITETKPFIKELTMEEVYNKIKKED